MTDAQYAIQVVARLTGLSAYVIRIWEQHYAAAEPHPTPGNRRLYSKRNVEKLSLLRDVTNAGHSIGQVASLRREELRKSVQGPTRQAVCHWRARHRRRAPFLDECMAAIKSLDGAALDEALRRGVTALGWLGMLQGWWDRSPGRSALIAVSGFGSRP